MGIYTLFDLIISRMHDTERYKINLFTYELPNIDNIFGAYTSIDTPNNNNYIKSTLIRYYLDHEIQATYDKTKLNEHLETSEDEDTIEIEIKHENNSIRLSLNKLKGFNNNYIKRIHDQIILNDDSVNSVSYKSINNHLYVFKK